MAVTRTQKKLETDLSMKAITLKKGIRVPWPGATDALGNGFGIGGGTRRN